MLNDKDSLSAPPEPAAWDGQPAGLRFACPACREPLLIEEDGEARCPRDGRQYRRQEGIWRFLLPEREVHYRAFIRDYEAIRRAEGRGSDSLDFYRALPFQDLSGHFSVDWRIRARSFRALVRRVVEPLEKRAAGPLVGVDLGAGNGWLSNRLAARGHALMAVDLLTNPWDGLGAFVHYETAFTPVQAEFDRLPLEPARADLVVFNASLHYAERYEETLAEALRVMRPGGRLVIMDTPIYSDPQSGARMVAERQAFFTQKYGTASDALASENYLTRDRLTALAAAFSLSWEWVQPFYGLRWALRPWKARLGGGREPAQFALIVGRSQG